ncbi:hypothetical protein BH11GEM2_BH11GEM2_13650 [soil metagenome]
MCECDLASGGLAPYLPAQSHRNIRLPIDQTVLPAADTLAPLAPYVSRLELAPLLNDEPDADAASVRPWQGAILFTDFAGFTALAERLEREGPVGAEKLSEILNWHYGILTDAIVARGGDIVLFAGDALLALFASDGDDTNAARRAAASALDMQRALAEGAAPHDAALGLRATIGLGDLTAHHVGGVDGRWLSLIGGAALDDVFRADRIAKAGRVQATGAAWRAIAASATGEMIDGEDAAIVHGLIGGTAVGRPANIPPDVAFSKSIESLVLPVVRERLLGGHAEFLAEFRDASIVFVSLRGIDPGVPADLDRLHSAAVAVQEEVARRNGSLYQMIRDDKGCVAVVVFGLPGQANDDDAARATDAAMSILNRMRGLGIDAGAGVATGAVFCGMYGGASRRNYGIIGPTTNRAARLMQASNEGVVADETTRARASRWMEFSDLPPVAAKGIAAPLKVASPVARRPTFEVLRVVDTNEMIGRTGEFAHIGARLRALADARTGGSIVLEADAGMGKSTLLRHAIERAHDLKLRVLDGAADSIEQGTAYLAMRPIIRTLLGVERGSSTAEARAAATAKIERLPRRMMELAPLLNVVLPLDFPENALTQQMSGTIRAANLNDLLLALVALAIETEPIVIALEDLHWTDDASLQLCGRLLDALPSVLLLATLRPMSPEPHVVSALTTGEGRERLLLDTLTPDDIVELIRRRLGATTIPVAVKELVLSKAEGNPFYSEEIALALRDSGVITIEGGECRLAGPEALSALNLPGTVKGVITSRIDRLDGNAQLALKVASVLGRSFDVSMLDAVHPSGARNVPLDAMLKQLETSELLVTEPGAEPRYSFRHALIHETTYNLLAFAQRRPLHAAAAGFIEATHADDLTPYNARLAYHWSRAERPEKAVGYLGEAGKQALESYANQSAVDFFSEAITLDEGLRGSLDADRTRASWHRQLAEGCYSLIQWDDARKHYEQAIQLSGFRPPRFGVATTLEVLKHVASRYASRLVFGDPAKLTAEERESCIEALRACDNLQVVYLWQGNRLSLAHTVFEGANIAARTGPSAESAFARAMLGYLLAVAGMRGIAERDLRSALEMAEASGQLLQRVSCNMYLGMTLSLFGRPREGIPYLEQADDLVSRLGAGLWKHRGKYMLAEPHLMIGNLDIAADLFAACATISLSVEPPITGFANAMVALCRIRQGSVDEAIKLIHGPQGIRLVRDNPIGLQLYNTLGALIEGYLWNGEWEKALEAAREGVTIPERGEDANGFFTGYNGHAAVARLFLHLIEQRKAGDEGSGALPPEAELWRDARRALKNFRKGTKLFPGAQAPYLLVEGLSRWLELRHDPALDSWRRCIAISDASAMPYEGAMARYEIGRHATDAGTRDRMLGEARDMFAKVGMPRYAERCDDARRPTLSAVTR